MQPRPPPDKPLSEAQKANLTGIYLMTIGMARGEPAEVLGRGRDGDEVLWLRFNLKVGSRHIKRFLLTTGYRIMDATRIEGIYEAKLPGYGPLWLDGTVVGIDENPDAKVGDPVTVVLADVSLSEKDPTTSIIRSNAHAH